MRLTVFCFGEMSPRAFCVGGPRRSPKGEGGFSGTTGVNPWGSIFSEEEDNLKQADALLADVKGGRLFLLAPSLSKYEVGSVIRFRKMTEVEKMACWRNFKKLPIKFIDLNLSDGSLAQAIAESANITFYDAVFILLAKKLGVPLVTANPKHQKSFPGVKVINLKDY